MYHPFMQAFLMPTHIAHCHNTHPDTTGALLQTRLRSSMLL